MVKLTEPERSSIRSEWDDTMDYEGLNLADQQFSKVVNSIQVDDKPTGGSSEYYTLPSEAENIQDLIESKSMSWNIANIFKACYRLGSKNGVDVEYDLRKLVYFSLRELGKQQGTKDYLALARKVIGSQTIKD